jgi:hypothetical protein
MGGTDRMKKQEQKKRGIMGEALSIYAVAVMLLVVWVNVIAR